MWVAAMIFFLKYFFLSGGKKFFFRHPMFSRIWPNDEICCNEACVHEANLLREKDSNVPVFHCSAKSCHFIEYENRGVVCSRCFLWMCDNCYKMDTYYGKKEPVYYCPLCYDILMLGRNPRVSFYPNDPIVVETQYGSQQKKQKTTTVYMKPSLQRSATPSSFLPPPPQLKLDETKTLLEIAFMKWPDIKPDMLAQRHKHPLDDTVWLDETDDKHLYGVQFEPGQQFETDFIQSTSSMYHMYFPNTYNRFEAIRCMLKGKEWGPRHPKYGKDYYSPDENQLADNLVRLLKDWKQNGINKIRIGKFVHFILECIANEQLTFAEYPFYLNFQHFQQFVRWRKECFDPFYNMYRTEMRFRSCKKYRRVGTCDLLATFKDQLPPDQCDGVLRIVMFDWKNCIIKHTGFNANDKGVLECADLPKCNKREYELQQGDYEKLAKQLIYEMGWLYNGWIYKTVQFVARYLVAFDESNFDNKADMVPLEDQQYRLTRIWNARALEVEKWEQNGRPSSKHKPHPKDEDMSDEETKNKLLDIIRETS